jgi:hypothetical protein
MGYQGPLYGKLSIPGIQEKHIDLLGPHGVVSTQPFMAGYPPAWRGDSWGWSVLYLVSPYPGTVGAL